MSRSATDDGDARRAEIAETDHDGDDDPEIEEDLFEEELRIDGICGVY